MSDALANAVAAIVAGSGDDSHWTVVLDTALRNGAVPPGPDARPAILAALAEATRQGLIEKTSVGTYRSVTA